MLIKVCGLREPQNIRAMADAGADMLGFIFHRASPRHVGSVGSLAGTIPDYSALREERGARGVESGATSEERSAQILNNKRNVPLRVGVFVDAMPQDIVTHVYNEHLDIVQLHGTEPPTTLRNLRHTLSDIAPHVKLMKAIAVRTEADIDRWRAYEDCADLLLFDTKMVKAEHGEGAKASSHPPIGTATPKGQTTACGGTGEKFDWDLLARYDGPLPFLLSGGIAPDDAPRVKAFHHPRCIGIDINSRFETAPALKDAEAVRKFIEEVRTSSKSKT